MVIYKPLTQTLKAGGRRLSLSLSFDRVLEVCDAWADEDLTDEEKEAVTFDLLIRKGRERRWLAQQDAETRGAAITTLFKEYIDTEPQRANKGPKAFDLKQDGEFVYAAFRQAYGIDLQAELGRMDWREFSALLAGLPTGTRLSEIIEIRTKPLPKADKYNQRERKALIDAKFYFRLKPDKPINMQDKLANLFEDLSQWAKS